MDISQKPKVTEEEFRSQNPEWILCDWMENRGLEQAILRRSFA
ncbi:hypothetical protein [Nostoc sp.]